jgi:hypothetical protein
MNRRIRTNRFLILSLAIIGMSLVSCEKDKKDAPELPPESAFVMNFGDFQEGQKSTLTQSNWSTAAFTVMVWNTVLGVTLAVPVASYIEAFHHEPVRIDNNTWKWSYTVPVNSVNYTADLYADVLDAEVTWEMYISQEGGSATFYGTKVHAISSEPMAAGHFTLVLSTTPNSWRLSGPMTGKKPPVI